MRHKESGCAILKHSFELQTASMASTSQTFIKLPLWNASTDKKILELQISQPSWAFMNLPMNHSYRGHISTETPPRRHVQQKVLSDASTRCVSHAHSHQRASCTSPDFFVKRGSSWNSLILEGLQPLLSFFSHLCDHICSHNFHMFSFMSPEHLWKYSGFLLSVSGGSRTSITSFCSLSTMTPLPHEMVLSRYSEAWSLTCPSLCSHLIFHNLIPPSWLRLSVLLGILQTDLLLLKNWFLLSAVVQKFHKTC